MTKKSQQLRRLESNKYQMIMFV